MAEEKLIDDKQHRVPIYAGNKINTIQDYLLNIEENKDSSLLPEKLFSNTKGSET